jgi:hypothetical protein
MYRVKEWMQTKTKENVAEVLSSFFLLALDQVEKSKVFAAVHT